MLFKDYLRSESQKQKTLIKSFLFHFKILLSTCCLFESLLISELSIFESNVKIYIFFKTMFITEMAVLKCSSMYSCLCHLGAELCSFKAHMLQF